MMKRTLKWIIVSFYVFAGLSVTFAADKKLLTLKEMISIKTIGSVAIAPSGDKVAFEVTSVDWEHNLFTKDVWLAHTDGSRSFPVTRGKDMNMAPAWTPDGKAFAFISTRKGKAQLYLFKPGYGEPERLFETENGVNRFAWSPDGKYIAFLTPETLAKEKTEKKNNGFDAAEIDESPPRAQLYLYEIATKESKPLATGDFHIVGFSWAPDGSKLAFVTSPKNLEPVIWTDQTMRVVNRDGTGAETLDYRYYGWLSRQGEAIWSPDARYLALAVGDLTKPLLNNPVLQAYDFRTGKSFNASGDADHFMYQYHWSLDGKYIYYFAYLLQNSQFFRLDFENRTVEQISHFPKIEINNFSIAQDGHTVVFSASTPAWPQELFFGDIDKPDQATRITNIHPELGKVVIYDTEEFSWQAEDGLTIYGNFVYPAGYQAGKKYPTVTLVHGGPLGNFPNSFNANYYCPAQYFAELGYLVYLPNVRGSLGWGSEFIRKNVRDWGGGDYRDLMAGLDHLVEKGLADEDKQVLWGASYGGYMANWVVTHTDRFKAVHSEVSLSNLYSSWSIAPIGQLLSDLYFEKNPFEDPDLYRKLSPITYAMNVKTPLLLTQNEKDQRVPMEQALEFYRAVKLTGTTVQLFIYPDEPHPTVKPNHQLDKLQKTVKWFQKYLHLEPES